MLELVKKALRITTDAFDDELELLISAGLQDLGCASINSDVLIPDGSPLVQRAVITYCKMNFGLPDEYDNLKRSYDEQKAQMATASGYTNWRD